MILPHPLWTPATKTPRRRRRFRSCDPCPIRPSLVLSDESAVPPHHMGNELCIPSSDGSSVVHLQFFSRNKVGGPPGHQSIGNCDTPAHLLAASIWIIPKRLQRYYPS